MSRIDSITVLLPEFEPRSREPGFVVRITTTRPYDRRDILSAMKIRTDERNGKPRQLGNLYGIDASRELARERPDLALQHADTFEYYVEGAP